MDVDENFIMDMKDLKNANFPLDKLFSLEVNHNNVKYEFLIRFSSKNKNLICLGSGAYDPRKLTPPIYNRHSWQGFFEESVIMYNDPTLYLTPNAPLSHEFPTLSLGWGIGKNEDWYLLGIKDIISILANNNHINPEDILFFGSSGGGFTSVVLSTLIKKSTAIINNPQIFCNEALGLFNNVLNVCFENLDKETVLKQYGYRVNAIELFKLEKYVPPMTYIVNVKSEFDLEKQLIPFMTKLSALEFFKDNVTIILYASEDGHNGVMDKDQTINLIKSHFR